MEKSELKNLKSLVTAILDQKGITYTKWLNEKHLELLAENTNIILESLNKKGDVQ